jgi:hypothetical protein
LFRQVTLGVTAAHSPGLRPLTLPPEMLGHRT